MLDISVQVRDDMGEAGESSTARGDFWEALIGGRDSGHITLKRLTSLPLWQTHKRVYNSGNVAPTF